ncbi:MAG: alkaline phosphatase D family protein [Bacteroidota bacterium]
MKPYFLFLSLLAFVVSCAKEETKNYPSLPVDGITEYFDSSLKPFYHGVASGDPLSDAVIIWTRVTPEDSLPKIEVKWMISESIDFQRPFQEGTASTSPDQDYTVKVDVSGLESGVQYFYQFIALGDTSIVGKTKTSPKAGNDKVRFGVVSCSNFEWGLFTSYRKMAEKDLDAVLHLGDYIYEYGPGTYGDTALQRTHYPPKEVISLQDYRLRYSQYRLDPDLRLAHQNHAFISIWDDHEIANDSYVDGAENHQSDEGDYITRREAARKAYYEWLPVRNSKELYRKFDYGDLVDLVMLDERLAGRTAPADSINDPSLLDSTRTMLGAEQLEWFKKQLTSSKAEWKVIGNQVIYSYLNWGRPSFSINLDSWDGYPSEQKEIAELIRADSIENVVFVTGDTHSSWAFEVTVDPFTFYDQESGEGAFAVEFGATSINSANSDEWYPTDSVIVQEERIVNSPINPHLKYANLRDHGYLILTLSEEQARADWYYVESLTNKTANERLGKTVTTKSGSNRLSF